MRASNQFADVTSGVVYIHASPAAVCPHVEWALTSTLNAGANLKWTPQPAMPLSVLPERKSIRLEKQNRYNIIKQTC